MGKAQESFVYVKNKAGGEIRWFYRIANVVR